LAQIIRCSRLLTSSTILYSSSTPSPSSYHPPCCPCCVEFPASSSFTSLASSIPSCPCVSGFSSSAPRMSQLSGLTPETAQQKAGPSFSTLLGRVSVSAHTRQPAHTRTGYLPSKLHLVLLDTLILCLQMLLTTISFEISLRLSSLSDPESSAIPSSPPLSPPPTPTLEDRDDDNRKYSPTMIIDLRFRHLINRLRNPIPLASSADLTTLPLPNTTPTPLSMHLRALLRRREEARRRVPDQFDSAETANTSRTEDTGRIPGSMSTEWIE
jgi:hypothetical protein